MSENRTWDAALLSDMQHFSLSTDDGETVAEGTVGPSVDGDAEIDLRVQ